MKRLMPKSARLILKVTPEDSFSFWSMIVNETIASTSIKKALNRIKNSRFSKGVLPTMSMIIKYKNAKIVKSGANILDRRLAIASLLSKN